MAKSLKGRNVVGLDLSLNCTGWARPNGESGVVVPPKGSDGCPRLNYQFEGIQGVLPSQSFVVLEGYSFAARSNTAAYLAELGGLVRWHLWIALHPFVVVAPTQLKKYVTGKGTSKKDEMRLGVFKLWGKEFKTTDEVDAYALAKLGEGIIRSTLKVGKARRVMLETLSSQIIWR